MENRVGKYHVYEDTYSPEFYPCQSDSQNCAVHNAGYRSNYRLRLDADRSGHRATRFEGAGLALESIRLSRRLAVQKAEPIRLRISNPQICARNFLLVSNESDQIRKERKGKFMGHIFISYNHKDKEYAHKLTDDLQQRGFTVWIDARLDYGSQWPHEIQKHLDTCDAFILIMTPRSFASEWVQSELQRAKRKLKPIFPLLLEGEEPWLSTESTQYYDVREANLPDTRFYSALKRVASTGKNAETFPNLKKPIGIEPSPKYRIEIIIAIIGAVATVLAACATVVAGLFGSPAMDKFFPAPQEGAISSSATETLLPSPTESVPSLSPTEPAASIVFSAPVPTQTLPPTPLPTKTVEPTHPPPPTVAPIPVSNTYYIEKYDGIPGTQRSAPLDYTINIISVNLLQVEVSAEGYNYSSDLLVHVLLDGVEIMTSKPIGPNRGRERTGLMDLSQFISPGEYTLTISPEGLPGNGNLGELWAWGADLIVYTNKYP
jgi:hypothetical protein